MRLLLLEEIRHPVVKGGKSHSKLLFTLEVQEKELLISTKCRGIKEPVVTSLERVLAPYLEGDNITRLRGIFEKVHIQKVKQVS